MHLLMYIYCNIRYKEKRSNAARSSPLADTCDRTQTTTSTQVLSVRLGLCQVPAVRIQRRHVIDSKPSVFSFST